MSESETTPELSDKDFGVLAQTLATNLDARTKTLDDVTLRLMELLSNEPDTEVRDETKTQGYVWYGRHYEAEEGPALFRPEYGSEEEDDRQPTDDFVDRLDELGREIESGSLDRFDFVEELMQLLGEQPGVWIADSPYGAGAEGKVNYPKKIEETDGIAVFRPNNGLQESGAKSSITYGVLNTNETPYEIVATGLQKNKAQEQANELGAGHMAQPDTVIETAKDNGQAE